MSEAKQRTAGKTVYQERLIEGRQCWVPIGAAVKDYEFAFVEKNDLQGSGKSFYVNISTRAKSWDLPDISELNDEKSLTLAESVSSGDTLFTLCDSANGERVYAPEQLPIDISPGHCWIPRADRIQQRFYLNVVTHEKVTALPPTLSLCRRVERMCAKYSVSEQGGQFKELLTANAGHERSLLSDLVIKYGPEPPGHNQARDILQAYYTKLDQDKLPQMDAELSQWAGREEELLADLKGRYGDPPPTYRQRVAAMYYNYNSSKLATLDEIMDQYCNREAQLLAALVKKYGREPSDGPTIKISVDEVKERVTRMYRKYDAKRLDSVDTSMEVYRGLELLLLEALVQKYGPEPSAASDDQPSLQSSQSSCVPEPFRDRLSAFYLRYNADKLQSVPAKLQRYAGREEELMLQLVRKYGPEPSNASPPQSPRQGPSSPAAASGDALASIRQRIKDLFERNGLGEKVGSIDDLLALNKGAEDSLLEALELKYAASPAACGDVSPTATPANKRGRSRSYTVMASAWKTRLTRFFTKYDADRLSSVDLLLANFAGREEELMHDLVQKYGPEDADKKEEEEEESTDEPHANAAAATPPPADEPALREERNAKFRSDEARFVALEQAKLQARIQEEEDLFRREEQAVVAARLAESHVRAADKTRSDAERRAQDTQAVSSDFYREKEADAAAQSASPSRSVFVNSLQPSALAVTAQLEEILLGIKAQLDVSERRSSALRDENDRVGKQLTDVRRQCDLELRGMRIHLEEVRARAAKAQSDAQLERVKLLAEHDRAEQKALKIVELERIKLAQDVTGHLSERRRLETQIQDQLVQLTLSNSTCQSLEEKHEHREKELVQLQQEVDALRAQLLTVGSKTFAAAGTQTDTPEQVEQSMRAVNGDAAVVAATLRPEEWKARALELERHVLEQQQLRQGLEKELAANAKIVALLKSKKKQLERTVGQLELQVLAIPDIPMLKTEQDLQLVSQRAELVQMQMQLEHTETESRTQRREISDLRALLMVHLAEARKSQKR